MNFGEWVRSWLSLLNLNQSWFYFASGISDGSINRWERGQSVRIDIFVVCCEVLAQEAGMMLLEMLEDALSTIPEYRYALAREGEPKC
jgi:hypothetical protein